MKIQVETKRLGDALRTTRAALAAKDFRPVLTYFYLEAEQNRLRIKATDSEVSIETSLPAVVATQGKCCVVGTQFYSLVSSLLGANINLELVGDVLRVTSSDSLSDSNKFEFPTKPASEFPDLPKVGNVSEVPTSIVDSMKRVLFSVSKDVNKKLNMTGIHLKDVLEKGSRSLIVEATDEYQINRVTIPNYDGPSFDALVSPEMVDLIMSSKASDLKMNTNTTHIEVLADDTTEIVGSLINATFPNVGPVFNSYQDEGTASISRSAFAEAVRRVMIMLSELDKSKDKGICLSFKKGVLDISSREDRFTGNVEVKYTGTGPDFKVSINPDTLIKYLDNTPGDVVEFVYSGEDDPIKLVQENQVYLVQTLINSD